MLTQARLKERVVYFPETGFFVWKMREVKNDYDRRWNNRYAFYRAGSWMSHGYRVIRVDGEDYTEHRLAWLYVKGEWPAQGIDQKDQNRANNKFENLRPADQTLNNANHSLRKENKVGKKGVFINRQSRYCAQICCNGKRKHLGIFASVDAAHAAYVEAAKTAFGEYARAG